MSGNEFEVVQHNPIRFHVFLVELLYRTPHLHKDFEISCILEGKVQLTLREETAELGKNDLFITNPYEVHELMAKEPALILSLQVSPDFFADYYPVIEMIQFQQSIIRSVGTTDDTADSPGFTEFMTRDMQGEYLPSILREIALAWYRKEPYYEIRCVERINQLFLTIFRTVPTQKVSDMQYRAYRQKGDRIRRILRYIDEHYDEKLLLTDIAQAENVSLYYLSHFFPDAFGMSFQKYLSRVRCEKARQLLLLTDMSLLDVGISSGFSDPKYFIRDFRAQYGCTPKEYRKGFQTEPLLQQQRRMLSTQEFLSPQSALVLLSKEGAKV